MYMHTNEGGMRRGEGCPHVGSGRQGPALVAAFAGERGGRRAGAGGRSPWQEEMITMIRSIMVMIMSSIKKIQNLPLVSQSMRAGRSALLAEAAAGGKERRAEQEAEVAAAAPSDE